MINLLVPLLLAHFLADFVLQTDKMASIKKERFSYHLYPPLVSVIFACLCLFLYNNTQETT